MNTKTIKKLLECPDFENRYIGLTLLDKLPMVEFRKFLKDNFEKNTRLCTYSMDTELGESETMPDLQYYKGVKPYYYLICNGLTVVDTRLRMQKSLEEFDILQEVAKL